MLDTISTERIVSLLEELSLQVEEYLGLYGSMSVYGQRPIQSVLDEANNVRKILRQNFDGSCVGKIPQHA
jgi:hypothetical protein